MYNGKLKPILRKTYVNMCGLYDRRKRRAYLNLKKRRSLQVRRREAWKARKNLNNGSIMGLDAEWCCGCSACQEACPYQAIHMEADRDGFLYPKIDETVCRSCGKCIQVCPMLHVEAPFHTGKKQVLAIAKDHCWGSSTAGGAYLALASRWLEEKDHVVCAPVFDGLYRVKHRMLSGQMPEASAKFKYLQSDKGNVFGEIRKLLEEEKSVLFAGTPCETAGLKRYLGQDYPGLLTVDMSCPGAFSPLSYEKYIRETYQTQEIKEIDFSSKKYFGSLAGYGVRIQKKDGSVRAVGENRDFYWKAIRAGVNVRKSCRVCQYVYADQAADISLAPVGEEEKTGIQVLDKTKALTRITCSTPKGKALLEKARGNFRDIEKCVPAKRVLSPIRFHENRDYFFELLERGTFAKAVTYAVEDRYDVGIIGLWYGSNYGSMMTYYGLHQTLKRMGLSVLMISNPLGISNEMIMDRTDARIFAREHYHISQVKTLSRLTELNKKADCFIVGSDQLWNYYLSRPYRQMYYLDFVEKNKKKIAYGTSFGGTGKFNGDEAERARVRENLRQFDAVSVREEYAVDICRETFGVEAVKVLDPVFLCDAGEYRALYDKVTAPETPYILAYILNPSEEKTQALKHLAGKYQCKVLVILDQPPGDFEKNKEAMGTVNDEEIQILKSVTVQEWLEYIDRARYVITDSFHGCCFSIILEKQFMAIMNKKRGARRFPDLMGNLGLKDYLVEDASQLLREDRLEQPIPYDKVRETLLAQRKASLKWLWNAVRETKQGKTEMVYGICMDSSRHDGEMEQK